MNRHLSSHQVSAWVMGEHDGDIEQHLDTCPMCRRSITQLEQVLDGFRGSARAWADEQDGPAAVRRTAAAVPVTPSWAAIAAMAVILICALLISHPARPTARASASDAALLKQVNEAVSRTVPGPMEPLEKLVSWDVRADAEALNSRHAQKE